MRLSDFKKIPCIVWCIAVNACVLLVWYAATPTLFNSYNSPHYVYRLDIYDASLIQRIAHYDQRAPSVIHLYRVAPKELLGKSKVVDLWSGSEISWYLDPPMDMGRVRVGRDALFENIPPECTEAAQIPGCPHTKP